MLKLQVNSKEHAIKADPAMPLLWALRDLLGLTGTKYSCGISTCGACTVLVDGKTVRSCVTPLSAVSGKAITTIEGLSTDRSHPVQRAWLDEQVPQCGYCQSGQIMSAPPAASAPLPTPLATSDFNPNVWLTIAADDSIKIRVASSEMGQGVMTSLPMLIAEELDTIEAQMESGIVYGLTAALQGEITIARGRAQQSNFNDYPLLSLEDCPEIEIHLLTSTAEPGGVGEPGTPPIAPAVANAVFAATGKPVRSLPIRLA